MLQGNLMKVQRTTFDTKEYFCGYKVVEGISDFRGIWLARTSGKARAYQKYMNEKYNADTKVFFSLIDRILFAKYTF